MPYYEMEFKRRLMIRNVTEKEQKIGYIEGISVNSFGNGHNSVSPENVVNPA